MGTSQCCRNGLGDRGWLPDPLADRSHCFVRHVEVPSHRSQPLGRYPQRDLGPLLLGDPWTFDHCGITSQTQIALVSGAVPPNTKRELTAE